MLTSTAAKWKNKEPVKRSRSRSAVRPITAPPVCSPPPLSRTPPSHPPTSSSTANPLTQLTPFHVIFQSRAVKCLFGCSHMAHCRQWGCVLPLLLHLARASLQPCHDSGRGCTLRHMGSHGEEGPHFRWRSCRKASLVLGKIIKSLPHQYFVSEGDKGIRNVRLP